MSSGDGGDQAADASPEAPDEPVDPAGARLALRMAADVLQGGTWHASQEAPARFAEAIADLEVACSPLPPPPQEQLDLALRATGRLDAAAEVIDDPAWLETYWRAPVAIRLAHLRRRVATEHLSLMDPRAPGVSDPMKEASALLGAYDDLTDATWTLDGWLDAKTMEEARRVAGVISWQTELGRAVVDPVTGRAQVISPTGKAIDDFLRSGKTALKAVAVAEAAASLGDEPAPEGAAGVADALTLVKRAGDAAVVVAAIVAETSALVARGLAAVATTPEAAASYRATAEACRSTARQIHGAYGVTAVLGIVDVATSLVVILDPERSSDDKLDAGVKALTGASKMGAAIASIAADNPGALQALASGTSVQEGVKLAVPRLAAMAPALTAVSFAVPAGWWVFKTSMRTMAETSIGIQQAALVTGLGDLIDPAELVSGRATVLVLAGEWADDADDPAMALAYLDAREAYVESLQTAFGELLTQVRDCGSPHVRRVFAEATARHPRLGSPDLTAEAALDAAADLIHITAWCLDHVGEIAAAEVGLGTAPWPEPGESPLEDQAAQSDAQSPTREEGEEAEPGECTP